jgi:hypothetical protein
MYLWNAELRIDFLIPERGRGRDRPIEVKSLAVKATPLRFVEMLLDHPVSVKEGSVMVSIPDPAAFCLHKLLIAGRRRRRESRLKDLEQALHVAPITREVTLKQVYRELPKRWQRTVLRTLERVVRTNVLLEREAQVLLATLGALG